RAAEVAFDAEERVVALGGLVAGALLVDDAPAELPRPRRSLVRDQDLPDDGRRVGVARGLARREPCLDVPRPLGRTGRRARTADEDGGRSLVAALGCRERREVEPGRGVLCLE